VSTYGHHQETTTPRPNRSLERRRELLPKIALAFAQLGYRRTTTAELAQRCGAQEVVLYRLWPDKKAMFIAAIDHVFDASTLAWEKLMSADDEKSVAERLLAYEATHHGEMGLYRIIFAGLSEADDPQVRTALARMYQRYHEFIVRRLAEHRADGGSPEAALAAWALIGMGTMGSIGRELGFLTPADRRRLWEEIGPLLLGKRRR
jgi:AcrR family transcriptional regulator